LISPEPISSPTVVLVRPNSAIGKVEGDADRWRGAKMIRYCTLVKRL
jgi:hypothetical protein